MSTTIQQAFDRQVWLSQVSRKSSARCDLRLNSFFGRSPFVLEQQKPRLGMRTVRTLPLRVPLETSGAFSHLSSAQGFRLKIGSLLPRLYGPLESLDSWTALSTNV